jgi:hypothetical protein
MHRPLDLSPAPGARPGGLAPSQAPDPGNEGSRSQPAILVYSPGTVGCRYDLKVWDPAWSRRFARRRCPVGRPARRGGDTRRGPRLPRLSRPRHATGRHRLGHARARRGNPRPNRTRAGHTQSPGWFINRCWKITSEHFDSPGMVLMPPVSCWPALPWVSAGRPVTPRHGRPGHTASPIAGRFTPQAKAGRAGQRCGPEEGFGLLRRASSRPASSCTCWPRRSSPGRFTPAEAAGDRAPGGWLSHGGCDLAANLIPLSSPRGLGGAAGQLSRRPRRFAAR